METLAAYKEIFTFDNWSADEAKDEVHILTFIVRKA